MVSLIHLVISVIHLEISLNDLEIWYISDITKSGINVKTAADIGAVFDNHSHMNHAATNHGNFVLSSDHG